MRTKILVDGASSRRARVADQGDLRWCSRINGMRPQPAGSQSRLLNSGQKQLLDIAGHRTAANDVWPQHKRRGGDEAGIETDHVKIVVEMLATAAALRPAGHPRVALPVVTDAADVASVLIGEEDVGAEIDALALALEAPAGTCR